MEDDFETAKDTSFRAPEENLEIQKRKEIVDKFNDASFHEDVKILLDIVKNAEYRELAFKYRIGLTEDQFLAFFNTLTEINEHLAMCQSILDAYVKFSNSTPNFKNLLNELYHFYSFISEQASRTFYFVTLEDEGMHFFEAGKFKKHVYGLAFLLARLKGTLTIATWYLIDIAFQNRQPSYNDGMMGNRFGGLNDYHAPYSGGYGNRYDSRMYDFMSPNRTTTKLNVHRDIGDPEDT